MMNDNRTLSIAQEKKLCDIIFSGDSYALELYIKEIGLGYDNLNVGTNITKLKNLLLHCYHNLWLRRIQIPSNIKEIIIEKIFKLQCIENQNCNTSNCKPNLIAENFKTIQSDLCQKISQLCENCNNENTFLYLCRYLTFKINTAKKLYKRLGLKSKVDYPWEQIQFILAIYVYSLDRNYLEEEEAGLYLTVLTKRKIIEHLNNFLSQFKCLSIDESLESSNDDNQFEPKDKNLQKNKKSKEKQRKFHEPSDNYIKIDLNMENQYPALIKDYWLIKNIYSLKILSNHIDIVISTDFACESTSTGWIIERCLLIIGEFTKFTVESPHLSSGLKQIISSMMPAHLQECVKQIRNEISHVSRITLTNTYHHHPKSKTFFINVVQDLIKIKDNIKFMLDKAKYKVIYNFTQTIRDLKTVNDISVLYSDEILNCMLFEIDRLVERFDSITLSVIKEKIAQLEELCEDEGSDEEYEAIETINKLISTNNFDYTLFITILASYAKHLSILKLVNRKEIKNCNYKQLLDILSDNLCLYTNSHNESLAYITSSLELLINSKNSNINQLAVEILINIHLELRTLSGLKQFRYGHKEMPHNNSLSESEIEVNQIMDFIMKNLKSHQSNVFKDKLDKALAKYQRINELIAVVGDLSKNIPENGLESKVNRIMHLIGTENNELDNKMRSAIQSEPKEKDFKTCLEFIKTKYKGNRKCHYENLVRGFMKPENYYLDAKIKLVTTFLNKVIVVENNNNISPIKLEFEKYTCTEEVIKRKYLSFMETIIEDVRSICMEDQSSQSNRIRLKVATEMALIKILEISHKFGGGDNVNALLSLRPDILIYCGKSLRNYLAHYDIIYRLLPLEPSVIVALMTKEIINNGVNWLPKQNYFLRKNNEEFDWVNEEYYYGERSLQLVLLQDKMIEALMKDDLKQLKYCIELGAYPRATDMYRRNALQISLDNSSGHCFQFLLNIFPKVIINSLSYKKGTSHPFKGCINLDITKLPSILSMIKLMLKFSGFAEAADIKTKVNIIQDIHNLIKTKFATWLSDDKWILRNFHLLVYMGDIDTMKLYCQSGLQESDFKPDINGDNPLHWAAALGLTDICEIILDKMGIPNKENKNGCSELDMALLEGKLETAVLLKERGAINFTLDPTTVAIICNQTQWIDNLLAMNPFTDKDGNFNIFLFGYAFSNSNEKVSLKLLSFIDKYEEETVVSFKIMKSKRLEKELFTKLVCCFTLSGLCFLGKIDASKLICHYLLKDKHLAIGDIKLGSLNCDELFSEIPDLDIYEVFKVNTPLQLACRGGGENNEKLIEYLIEEGADINEENLFQFSSLHNALYKGNERICIFLIENGSNLSARTPFGFHPIHISSEKGLIEVTKELLQRKVNINVLNNDLRTPLHLAVHQEHIEIVELLVAQDMLNKVDGIDSIINNQDSEGITALYIACIKGCIDIAKILLDHGADLFITNQNHFSVLHAACYSGREDIVQFLINQIPVEQRAAKINCVDMFDKCMKFLRVDEEGIRSIYSNSAQTKCLSEWAKITTPLYEACLLGHNKIVQLFIKHGATIVHPVYDSGQTGLHAASIKGYCDVIETLLENESCSIDCPDNLGNTALSFAIKHNNVDAVSLLLHKGADVNKKNYTGCTPLHHAANYGHYEIMELILSKTNDVNPKNSSGLTPIMVSVSQGNFWTTKLLIVHNADLAEKQRDNPLTLAIQKDRTDIALLLLDSYDLLALSSPDLPYLHYAVYKNNLTIMKILLKKGIPVDFVDKNGFTPLHLAASLGYLDCANILVQHRVNISARVKDCHSFTALHLAVLRGQTDMVKFLIDNGAVINSFGANFATPLYLAVEQKDLEIVKILINNGAKINVIGPYKREILFEAILDNNYDIVEAIIESSFNKKPQNHGHGSSNFKNNQCITGIIDKKQSLNHKLKKNFFTQSSNNNQWVLYYNFFIKKLKKVKQLKIQHYFALYGNNTRNSKSLIEKNNVLGKALIDVELYEESKPFSLNTRNYSNRPYKYHTDYNISYNIDKLRNSDLANPKDYLNLTALHWAIIAGNLKIGELLMSTSKLTNCYTYIDWEQLIEFAIKMNRFDFSRLILLHIKEFLTM